MNRGRHQLLYPIGLHPRLSSAASSVLMGIVKDRAWVLKQIPNGYLLRQGLAVHTSVVFTSGFCLPEDVGLANGLCSIPNPTS